MAAANTFLGIFLHIFQHREPSSLVYCFLQETIICREEYPTSVVFGRSTVNTWPDMSFREDNPVYEVKDFNYYFLSKLGLMRFNMPALWNICFDKEQESLFLTYSCGKYYNGELVISNSYGVVFKQYLRM